MTTTPSEDPKSPALPPLLPGSEYQVDDADLWRVVNLLGYGVSACVHVQVTKPAVDERMDLLRRFKEFAMPTRGFFTKAIRGTSALEPADRLSFVKTADQWIEDVLAWVRRCVLRGVLDWDTWHALEDRFWSIFNQYAVIQSIQTDALDDRLDSLRAEREDHRVQLRDLVLAALRMRDTSSARGSGESPPEDALKEPICVAEIARNIPKSKGGGRSDKLAGKLKRKRARMQMIGNKWHVEKADALRLLPAYKKWCEKQADE